MTHFVTVLLLLVPFGTAPASPAGDMFDDADANNDAFLAFEELTAVLPRATHEQFAAVDLNGDRSLDYDEFEPGLDEGYLIFRAALTGAGHPPRLSLATSPRIGSRRSWEACQRR